MAKGDKKKTSDRTTPEERCASSAASEPTEPEAPVELPECASGSAASLDREKEDELEPPKGHVLTNIIVQRLDKIQQRVSCWWWETDKITELSVLQVWRREAWRTFPWSRCRCVPRRPCIQGATHRRKQVAPSLNPHSSRSVITSLKWR